MLGTGCKPLILKVAHVKPLLLETNAVNSNRLEDEHVRTLYIYMNVDCPFPFF